MKLLANEEGGPGVERTVEALRANENGLDSILSGIALVERSTKARSVGYGGWPNLVGEMEFDASVMDGDCLESGAVGALRGYVNAAEIARNVKDSSQYQILVGAGAARFAKDSGFSEEKTLFDDSKREWQRAIQNTLTAEQLEAFPEINLREIPAIAADPELLRDTTVFLCRDHANSMYTATSTSGWAWKYPGRLGDAPICGAGFYADSRFGAAACTHTGEMNIRTCTAHTIIAGLKSGLTLADAVQLALEDLKGLKTGYLAGVVIHALDSSDNHIVANFRCEEQIRYWVWTPDRECAELRDAEIIVE